MFDLIDENKRCSPEELRTRVIAFEREQLKKPQVALKVVHHFSHGVVAREMHAPAGIEITGAIHKFANVNTLSQGEMLVTTDKGIEHVKAPYTVVSPPGVKRAALTLTDCIWTTYIGTHETDIDIIEQLFTAKTEQEYLEHCAHLQLKGA